MRTDLYRVIGFVLVVIVGLLGIAAGLHVLVTLPFGGKEAEWVGALGTTTAVLASFFLFQRQRSHELEASHKEELRRRLLAMQTVSDVAYRSLDAIKKLAEAYQCRFQPGVTPDLAPRLPELRGILDRFADPTADRIVVLVALTFSTALAETQDDIRVRDMTLEDYVINRLSERITELETMLDRLIAQLIKHENHCRAHGIVIDYGESVVAGD